MLPLSRKIKLSIQRNLNSLIDKTFDEQTIKELLINLREIGNEIKSSAGKSTEPNADAFDKTFSEFIDICNCIAHSNRTRGGDLEKNIREHIEKIVSGLEEGGDRKLSDIMSVEQVISGDSIVAAMLASIYLYLSTYDKEFDTEKLEPVFEDKADISLCIISLLQDTAITLKKDNGIALLQILVHEGNYRLYCRALNNPIERGARERTGGKGKFVIGFPVVVTSAKCEDALSFEENTDELPRLVETYRDKKNKLHVKFVD